MAHDHDTGPGGPAVASEQTPGEQPEQTATGATGARPTAGGPVAWALVKAAFIGFFLTRLVFLPIWLVGRWLERESLGPTWLPHVIRQASWWVPLLVAVVLVVAEAGRRDVRPRFRRRVRDGGRPRRGTWAAWGLFLGAPVSAEYLAAYLPETGQLVELLVALVILAPLYGGPALLIREVSVRTGRGWPARLAWAAAFGVALPCLVDLSAFTPHSPDIEFWDEYWRATAVSALGISALPLLSWVLGHVVLSMSAPLAMFDGLLPGLRRRPLLSRWTAVALVVGFVAAAALIRWDTMETSDVSPSPVQTAVSVAAVVGLLALGWYLPRSLVSTGGRAPGPGWLLAAGLVGQIGLDLVPSSWLGFGLLLAGAGGGSWLLWRWARRPHWGPAAVACLAAGAIAGRTLIGFLAPVPLGADPTAKYVQNVVLLIPVLVLAWLTLRQARREPA